MRLKYFLSRVATIVLIAVGLPLLAGCNVGQAEPTVAPEATEAAANSTPEPAADSANTDIGAAGALAPAERDGLYSAPPPLSLVDGQYYYATFKTAKGDIKVQLFAQQAPKAVNNFVFLAREGFYNDTTFHRVLDGFMAQGGDPTGTGGGGPGYEFENESYPGLEFDRAGLLAMANRGPNTNGSQFFLTFGPADWLNGGYTIFGEVIEGLEVLDQLTRRDPNTNPNFAGDAIETVTIEQSDASLLPTPEPPPPTPTPTVTPTPYAPTSLDNADRPLAQVPAADRVDYFNTAPEMVIDTSKVYTALISTSQGEITLALDAISAPVAVNNFVVLANLGFYDGVPINQVVPGQALVFGSPDNVPINDVGYAVAAELNVAQAPDVGSAAYMPLPPQDNQIGVSSGSQVLLALIQPPAAAVANYSFFAKMVEGADVLNALTTDDTIDTITISVSEQ
ncbi:MAG: peptidylprolyl isomerase [Caldilineaceae bacterium]